MSKISLNDIIVRKFTKELTKNKKKTVYDLFNWKKVDVITQDFKTGETLFEGKDLEFPTHYSQKACDIIAEKYFRRARVPEKMGGRQGREVSLKQVVHRMTDFLVRSVIDENLITKEQGQILYDEIAYMMLNQMFAFNTPQWLNTGLDLYYKDEPCGNYYFDIEKGEVVECEDGTSRTQASACFILSIDDKLLGKNSITEQFVSETKLFKGGSGTGSNFSKLRAKGESLSKGGTSSGVMSFLDPLDRSAGSIKSGGTARRSAKMVQLDVDHPEIFDFMTWKAKEEDKVRALGKMGYSIDFGGEAYETVSGQNGNNTVRFDDEFMNKVDNLETNDNDSEFELKGRKDSSINKNVKVSDLWNTFNESAHACADPAPCFDDRFNEWHTCPIGEDGKYNAKHNRINSTNPCGEYAFLDDTACNLASINLVKFYNEETEYFNTDEYKHCISLVQILLEGAIHWGKFPTEDVARKSHLFRTTGLGIAHLGGLLMSMALPYDSDEARAVSSGLMSILTGQSYFISSLMAKQIGTFEKYELNKEHMLKVIRNHAIVNDAIDREYEGLNYEPIKLNHVLLNNLGWNNVSDEVKTAWLNAVGFGELYGFRNAQVSVIAPTGTISFAMDCTSTSLEPYFAHVVWKKTQDGEWIKITNPNVETALRKLKYSEDRIKDIKNYIENGDGNIEFAPHILQEHLPIFDTANKCGTGERYIEPLGHVRMMGALQPHVSGAISKTVNLPAEATVQNFKDVVLQSWRMGCKGISLYRDGSKATQPLNSVTEINNETKFEDMLYADLVKIANEQRREIEELKKEREIPTRKEIKGIRQGTTHPAMVEGVKVYTTINRNEDNEIAEVYMTTDREGSTITGLLNALSKMISLALQYHVPPKKVAKTLRGQKYEPCGFVGKHPYIKNVDSISDLVSKIIEIELGDYTRCQVKPEKTKLTIDEHGISITSGVIDWSKAISSVPIYAEYKDKEESLGQVTYEYGKVCSSCGGDKMQRNGSCYVCSQCGTTTGCS